MSLFLGVLLTMTFAIAEESKRDPVHVGIIMDFTGPISAVAAEMKKGIELALSEPGAWPIVVHYEDDHGLDQKQVAKAINRFATMKDIPVVMNWVYTTTPTVAPIATRAKLPVITFWDSNKGLAKLGPYVFSSGISTELVGKKMARYAIEALKLKKVAILGANDPWSEIVSETFGNTFRELGGEIIFQDKVDPEEKDVRAIILKAKKVNAEGIFAPLYLGSLYSFINQSKELGFNGALLTGDGFQETDIKLLGASAEKVVSMQATVSDAAFIKRYHEKYGAEATPTQMGYTGLAYDAVKILNTVFHKLDNEHKPITRENVRNELSTVVLDGVTGRANLVGDSEKGETIVVVKDGVFVPDLEANRES